MDEENRETVFEVIRTARQKAMAQIPKDDPGRGLMVLMLAGIYDGLRVEMEAHIGPDPARSRA